MTTITTPTATATTSQAEIEPAPHIEYVTPDSQGYTFTVTPHPPTER